MAVAILVLQTFTIQCRTTSCRTKQEAACTTITSCPCKVTDTLETEHGVVDVERNHLYASHAVGSCGSEPASERASFVDAFFQNLTIFGFFVEHHLIRIHRLIELAYRGIDTQLTEHTFHTKGTRLIWHDRYDVFTDLLITYQCRQYPDKCHRGGDLAITCRAEHILKGRKRRHSKLITFAATCWHETAHCFTALTQVLHFRAVISWFVV